MQKLNESLLHIFDAIERETELNAQLINYTIFELFLISPFVQKINVKMDSTSDANFSLKYFKHFETDIQNNILLQNKFENLFEQYLELSDTELLVRVKLLKDKLFSIYRTHSVNLINDRIKV